jgi:hypothetical protein
MANDVTNERIEVLANDLRKIPVFADLSPDQLGWLASKCV